jgi:CubicO group peptidase (beta-lactamase class C family)
MGMNKPSEIHEVDAFLTQYTGSEVPGLHYIVLDADKTLFEFAGGWADIQNQTPMTLDTTLMGYSMTKTFTAVAVLQLVEDGKIGLDDEIDDYITDSPYSGQHITVRQLLVHTAGIPNPIPLRWAHLVDESASFDEKSALAQVLQGNDRLKSEPGAKYAYSNIGYWLLGSIIEQASGQSYTEYVKSNILQPLDTPSGEMGFDISAQSQHANGYLAKYSLTNFIKGFVLDSKFWDGYEGNWLRLENHYLNGPSFGGLVGTGRSFALFLQDQLNPQSVLLEAESRRLLETQQTSAGNKPIPMTLGWHVGEANGLVYYFKEGGGGGFQSEMRIYPTKGIASVVMVNRTNFNSTQFLNRLDAVFLRTR